MDHNIVRIVELQGSPYERGKQYGEACKDEILALIDAHYHSLAQFAKSRAYIDFTKQQISILSSRYLSAIQEYAPDLIEEVKGIADTVKLPFHEILFLNCFLDVYDLIFPGISHPLLFGCTTFAATKPATQDGSTIVAQNLDLRSFFNKFGIILRITSDEYPTTLCFTMAGVVGLAGINQEGIALVFNKLVPKDTSYGVPYPFLARKILQQARMGQVLHTIGGVQRASGSYCLVGSPDTGVFGVECTSKTYQVFYPEKGFLVHSNHYIHSTLHEQNRFYFPFAGDSFIRINQATNYLSQRIGSIDVESTKELAKDHANFPDSICRHSDIVSEPFSRAETMASLIFETGQRCCWVSAGPPCQNEFIHLAL